MEYRVAALEKDLGDIKSEVKSLRTELSSVSTNVAEIKGKVSMMPGYTGITVIVGLIGALVVLAVRFLPTPV